MNFLNKTYRRNKHIDFKHAIGKIDIYGRMFHDCYEIYMLLNGKVEFINDHTRSTIYPFNVVIIPPGEYHQFVALDNIDSYERCVLNIKSEHFGNSVLADALKGKELLKLSPSHRISENFAYLIACMREMDEADFSYILSAIATDIVFLIKNDTPTHELLPGSLRTLSLDLMHYINTHYTQPLDLNALSQKFHFSVSSLCHIFKDDFGISIKKYILQKRMHAANLALQHGEKPEVVSAAYGFSNYSTFYRAYKSFFGIAPSETGKRI